MSECSSCGGDITIFANKLLAGVVVINAKPTQTDKSTLYYLWRDDDWVMIPARNEKEDVVVKIRYRNRLHVPHVLTCGALEMHFRKIGQDYEKANPKDKTEHK